VFGGRSPLRASRGLVACWSVNFAAQGSHCESRTLRILTAQGSRVDLSPLLEQCVLVAAVRQSLKSAFGILGVSAPDRMDAPEAAGVTSG